MYSPQIKEGDNIMKFKFGIKEVVAAGIGTALFVALTEIQIPLGFIPNTALQPRAALLAFVAFQDLDGSGSQVDLDHARALLFGLGRYVLNGDAVVGGDDVVFGEGEKVADTAADVALEDEDVASGTEVFVIAHIRLIQEVAFLGCEVVGGTVLLGTDGILAEGVILGVAHIDAPAPVSADGAHVTDDGVVAALAGSTFVLGMLPGVFVFLHRFQTHAILQLDGLK